MCRLMNDNRIREISSSVDIRGLNLLDSRTTVGSLSENDEYSYDEMERFWSNLRNIRQSIATGSEPFSGEMLNPKSEIVLSKEMLDLMVKYYLASYENFDFQALFDDGPEDSIVISRVTINKFGRCRIGSEVLGSTMSSRHVKSSFILVNFITRDDKVDCETCNVELWKNEFYSYSRDSIIPVQNILCRFVPVKCKISNRQDAIEYLAINPINRKFHIR